MANAYFKDKVVVITGASSGIGRELAYQLASQGAKLSLAARDVERLEVVRAECEKRGGQAIVIPTDVAEQAQCENLVRKTVEQFGRIDILVNNAGISMWAYFDEVTDLSIFEKIMRVNYLGSVYCTYYALPHLKASRGQIVGVSSLTGKNGVPTRSGYAASKHAMVGFFDTLRIELADDDVAVTMIYPDFVATETRVRAFGPDGKPLGESPVREGEIMTVEECVELMLPAIQKRKRELVMSLRAKVGQYVKPFAPKLIDNIARKAIEAGK
ncbi:MAG: SDR family oxidoreductase [Anaerolineales bacterium]|nr:SDR family oxidoreductase [Anaerolineales bacterium]